MNKQLHWVFYLAKKYMGTSRRRGVKIVMWLALLGVTLGVGTLTVTQAVLTGFERVFQESILGFNAHLVVLKQGEMADPEHEEKLLGQELKGESKGVTPFLYREGLLISHGKVKGAVLKGIDPLTFSGVYDVKVRLLGNGQVPANIKELLNISGEVPALVLGADLAEDLGINQPGETVKVFLPKKKDGAAAKSFQVFKVTGTFSTGLYEYDHGFAFVNLSKLQKIFDVSGMATGIEFKLNHPEQAEEISKGLKPHLGQLYDSVSWQKLNAPLFRALRLERIMFFVIMSMVVAVAAFNIVGVLLLMIFEKSREISILRALGASYFGLKRVFGIQGLVLGALGSLGGMILGGFLVWILKSTHFLKLAKEVYLVGEIPVDFSLVMALWIVGASLVITFLATQIGVARLKKVPLDL